MDMMITPSRLSGTLDAISSKSFAHRLLICAALADQPTRIHLNGLSDDINATIRCLQTMGCSINNSTTIFIAHKLQASSPSPSGEPEVRASVRDTLLVEPLKKPSMPSVTLDCGESGATARFLLPLVAHLFDSFTLTGSGRLPGRPFAPLCKALANAGCAFDTDTLPLTGRGKIQAGDFAIAGDVSSQFISGLLFVLPLLGADSRISITTPLQSVAYVDMTIEVLALFGIEIERGDSAFLVKGNQRYRSPEDVTAEGDWSNAAFFLCMGALGGSVSLRGLSPQSTQGDKEVMEILKRFGAEIDQENLSQRHGGTEEGEEEIKGLISSLVMHHKPDWKQAPDSIKDYRLRQILQEVFSEKGTIFLTSEEKEGACRSVFLHLREMESDAHIFTVSGGDLRGTTIDASQIPDLVPTLAVVASVAEGETVIYNAQRLRMKESDRIQSTFDLLSGLGADVRMTDDGLVIRGKQRLRGGTVEGAGDHRIVMAAATAACVCENPVVNLGYEAVNKSYPSFFEDFRAIGGVANVV